MNPSYLVTLDLTAPETHRVKVSIATLRNRRSGRPVSDELPPLLRLKLRVDARLAGLLTTENLTEYVMLRRAAP